MTLTFLQFSAVAMAFFATFTYIAFARSAKKAPAACYFLSVGFLANAFQKLTVFPFLQQGAWGFFIDHGLLPWGESLCYAVATTLLLVSRSRVIRELDHIDRSLKVERKRNV